MKTLNFPILFTVLMLIGLSACSSTDKFDSSTAQGSYAWAEELEKKERYEEAITQYTLVKNKFPYTSFATESELKIGDVNFSRESYIQAQGAYQVFKELHPSHKKSDYVTFRLALSFFNQLPSTIDRDLGIADQAILYFDEVITSYPSSTYVEEAQKKKIETLKMLLDKQLYIANFYYIRDKYQSALARYEDALKVYSGMGKDPEILLGAARSSFKFGDRAKFKFFYSKLTTGFPNSSEAETAKKEMESGI